MPYALARRLLFGLDPETAHDLTMGALSLLDRLLPAGRSATGPLPIEIAGIAFPSPIGLAAGLDKDGVATRALAALGFGFLEVGTVTPRPQPGNPRPRLFRIPEHRAILNRMGFNSTGAREVARRLERRTRRVPLGINVGPNRGTPPREVVGALLSALRLLAPLADYIVVNLSSPNTPGLRDLLGEGHLEDTLATLLSALEREGLRRPLFLKVSPDMSEADVDRVGRTAMDLKLDALIATNTTVTRPGVPDRWAAEAGGLSGPPLAAASDRVLARLGLVTDGRLPLVACGGVESAGDAYRKIRLGASLVQVYTGLIYHGPGLPGRIVEGLARLLARDGFRDVASAVGSGRPQQTC